jgi:hypothetical protein
VPNATATKDAATLLKELFRGAITSIKTTDSQLEAQLLEKYIDPNVIVYQPDSLPWGGEHHGIDAFKRAFAHIKRNLDVNGFEIRDILGRNDYAMVLSFSRMKLADGTIYGGYQSEHTWWKSGKIVEVRVFWFDTAAVVGAPFFDRGD